MSNLKPLLKRANYSYSNYSNYSCHSPLQKYVYEHLTYSQLAPLASLSPLLWYSLSRARSVFASTYVWVEANTERERQGRIFIAVFSDKLRGTATVNLWNCVANYVAKNGILRGNYAVKTSYYVVLRGKISQLCQITRRKASLTFKGSGTSKTINREQIANTCHASGGCNY